MFNRAFVGRQRIATVDEPSAWIVLVVDLSQIASEHESRDALSTFGAFICVLDAEFCRAGVA